MKIVIVAYPTREIPISVVETLDSKFLMEALTVWYKDLYSTVVQLKAKYPEVDEIVLFGPVAYIEHIAYDLGSIFENDDDLQISIMVNDEIDEAESEND